MSHYHPLHHSAPLLDQSLSPSDSIPQRVLQAHPLIFFHSFIQKALQPQMVKPTDQLNMSQETVQPPDHKDLPRYVYA